MKEVCGMQGRGSSSGDHKDYYVTVQLCILVHMYLY